MCASNPGRKLDFIILSSHASGRGALSRYINSLPGVKCLDGYENPITIESINQFINCNDKIKKGIFIETSNRCNKNTYNYITSNTCDNCLLIVLLRDPLEKLISSYNYNVNVFAHIATGCSNEALEDTYMHMCGYKTKLIERLCKTTSMSTVYDLYPLFSNAIKDKLFIDMNQILPANAHKTLDKIYRILFGHDIGEITFPDIKFNSIKYGFVNWIKPLIIQKNNNTFSIKPAPIEYLTINKAYTDKIVFIADSKDYKFNIYDFDGKLAFVVTNSCTLDDKRQLTDMLSKNKRIIANYCEDLTQRHKMADQIYNLLKTDTANIMDICKSNPATARYVYNFYHNNTDFLREIEELQITKGMINDENLSLIDSLVYL